MTCPAPELLVVFAEDSRENSNYLQVPHSNLLLPGVQRDFKSASMNNISSESIGIIEDSSYIKFPSKPKSPNRLNKKTKPPLSPSQNIINQTQKPKERTEKRSKTILGQSNEKKKSTLKFCDSPKGQEEVKLDVTEKRDGFYWNSSGESTPHLYVDYQQRLNGILLIHFAEEKDEIGYISSDSD
jgi:hypothetical protein